MRRLNVFIYGILAGIAIGFGGLVFLSIENKVTGAIFFTIGMFTVLTQGLNLFTGKVCYVFERDSAYAIDLIFIWLGNLAGAFLTGSLALCTRIAPPLTEKAVGIAQAKLDDNLFSIFILAVLCNILIFIAVDGYNKNPHEFGKYYAAIFGVAVFIICGFEHCVANMLYFTVAKAWSVKTLLYVIVMTLGNSVGGIIFPLCRQFKEKSEKQLISK